MTERVDVAIVGAGQAGLAVSHELSEAGVEHVVLERGRVAETWRGRWDGFCLFLACGRAPWMPRRIGEHDLFWWASETGFLDSRLESLPAPAARLAANVLATGQGGGHDLHLRTLRGDGVTLLGHFTGADGRYARFADDLGESVAWGDAKHADFMNLVRRHVAERGLPSPLIREPEPFDGDAPATVDLRGFGAVIFAGGFRPGYGWVEIPGAFDPLGFPIAPDGASTAADGLYFAGVHFLRKRSRRSPRSRCRGARRARSSACRRRGGTPASGGQPHAGTESVAARE